MGKHSCVLENRPRVSGKLWDFDQTESDRFEKDGVITINDGPQGKILDVSVKSREKVLGVEFNISNDAVVWTEQGSIFLLMFEKNKYRKVGKLGKIKCANIRIVQK